MTEKELLVRIVKHLEYISKQIGYIEQNTSETKNSVSSMEGDLSVLSTIEEEITDILDLMPAPRQRIPEKKPPQKKKKGSK